MTIIAQLLPDFPPCTVRGHDHPLTYLHTTVQKQTGDEGHMLECPTGAYRFFYLAPVWAALGTMARYSRPRYGWPG